MSDTSLIFTLKSSTGDLMWFKSSFMDLCLRASGSSTRNSTLKEASSFIPAVFGRDGSVSSISMIPIIFPTKSREKILSKLSQYSFITWELGYRYDGANYSLLLFPLNRRLWVQDISPFIEYLSAKFELEKVLFSELIPSTCDLIEREFLFASSCYINEKKPVFSIDEFLDGNKSLSIKRAWAIILNESRWAEIYRSFGEEDIAIALENPGKRFDSPITGSKNTLTASSNSASSGGFMDWSAVSPDTGKNYYSPVDYLSSKYYSELIKDERVKAIARHILSLFGGSQSVVPVVAKASRSSLVDKRRIEIDSRMRAGVKARAIREGVNGSHAEVLNYLTGRMGSHGRAAYAELCSKEKPLPWSIGFNPSASIMNQDTSIMESFPTMVSNIFRFNKKSDSMLHVGDHYTLLDLNQDIVSKSSVLNAKRKAKAFFIEDGAHEDLNIDIGTTSGGGVFFNSLDDLKKSDEIHLTEGIENAFVIHSVLGKHVVACADATGLISIILPPQISHVVIHVDLDASGTGLRAAMIAASRFKSEGRSVRLRLPTGFESYTHIIHHNEKIDGIKWSDCINVANRLKAEGRTVVILSRLLISQSDIAKEDVLNTNCFKILMKLSTEISNYKNSKKNIKHAFEQSEHCRHIAINILDSLNSVLLNSNWEPVKKDTLLAPIKKIISRSLLSKELRSLLELLGMELRLESHSAEDIIALLTLNELIEVFKNNAIPDHAADRGDIVITELSQGIPFNNKLINIDTRIDDGRVVPIIKGYDLIDEVMQYGFKYLQ